MVALLALLLTFLLASAVGSPLGTPSNADDVALLRAALAGQMQARNKLATRLAPVIRARLRRSLAGWPDQRLGQHDVDDLTHLCWCRLLENDSARLRNYNAETGVSLVGYVSMVAQQLFLNVLEQHKAGKRSAAATVSMDDPDAADGVVAVASTVHTAAATEARSELSRVWAALMATLPEKGRAVLAVLYADGLEPDEAARVLGVEKQVVYNWQFKIRQAARELL